MKQKKSTDDTADFERALQSDPVAEQYVLRLYVTGTTPRSVRAIQNIRKICEDRLHGRYDLEVIDIFQNPGQAKPEQVVVTPTLIRMLPMPVRRLIGDLSDAQRVLVGLDILPRQTSTPEGDGNAS